MYNPKVSVVIPVYNVEKYLDRCLSSVVNQTYNKLEIILVDDGSKDGSASVCDEWAAKDDRIVVVHKLNEGAGAARNTGLGLATGEYVTFVDSDDTINAETIKKCVSVCIENGSDVVLFGRYNIKSDGTSEKVPISSEKTLFAGNEIVSMLLPGMFTYERGVGVGVCGKMFRLDIIRKNNVSFPPEKGFVSEDAVFILEYFAHAGKTAILPENYYCYYQNEGSLSRSYDSNYASRVDNFLIRSTEICNRVGYPESVLRSVKARYLIYMLAGMKLIAAGELSDEEKKAELMKMFNAPVLRQTLTRDVIQLNKPSLRLFYNLLRLRMYRLCRMMLMYKART